MTVFLRVIPVALLVATGCASAQNLRPGLWEIATQMQGKVARNDNISMSAKELQNLPPEQRKIMEAMMAQQAKHLGNAPGVGMSFKICMTKEMVERNDIPTQQGDCKHSYSPRFGNIMQFSFVCTNPPSSGEGQFQFTSPEAYEARMAATSATQKMYMQSSGRWMATDCGTIKPLPATAN